MNKRYVPVWVRWLSRYPIAGLLQGEWGRHSGKDRSHRITVISGGSMPGEQVCRPKAGAAPDREFDIDPGNPVRQPMNAC